MKVGFSTSLVLLWILPLISFLAMVSYGDVDKNLNIIVKDDRVETEEARIETFEVDGHVIDCIDMNKQPAFDNPLLINHTIQMEPTNYPEKTRENNSVVGDSQPWYLPKSCPKGSIPIWRAKRIEHSRDHNASSIGHHDSYEDSASGVYELSDVFFHGRKYNGAKATINVWRPEVETNVEQSGAEIWISSNDKKTQLRAGWLVSPNINGDEKTRFFVGGLISSAGGICYNYACRGFVQTNPRSILQTYLKPVSVYGGQQYAADVEIFMDERTRNWWVRQGVSMGYFPEELVPALDRGADFLAFGGHVYNAKPHGQHTITQMGSGHFSQEGFKKAGFFKEIKVSHAAGGYGDPSDADISEEHTDHPNCYDLQAPEREGGYGSWGYYFFYGGPGRSAKCI